MKTATHPYEDKLLELAYGELPAPEASAVQSHVRACARCTGALAEIQGVRQAMGALPMQTAPDAGLESLFAYADQAARRNAAGPVAVTWWRGAIAPLAGVCALGLVAVVAYRSQREGPSLHEAAVMQARPEAPAEPSRKNLAPAAPAKAEPAPFAQNELARSQKSPGQGYKQEVANAAPLEDRLRERDDAPQQALGATPGAGEGQGSAGLGVDLDQAARLSQTRRAELSATLGTGAGLDDGFGAKDAPKKVAEKKGSVGIKSKPSTNKEAAFDEAFGDERAQTSPKTDAVAKGAPPAPPPVAAAPVPSSKLVWGPSAASTSSAAPSAAPAEAVDSQKAAAEERPAAKKKPVAAGAAVAVAAPEAENSPAPRGSLGVSMGGSSGRSVDRAEPAQAGDDGALSAGARAGKQAEDLVDARRRVVADLEQLLLKARAASSARDSQTEVQLAQQVLARGAQSSQRVEALTRLCNALELLQRPDEAQPYCDALVREFPSSPAARAVVERQQRQRVAPSPRATPQADVESTDKARKPAKASPADAK